METFVHRWEGPPPADRDAALDTLGAKGLGLLEMTQLGLPVPAGFTLTTGLFRSLRSGPGAGQGAMRDLEPALRTEVARLEERTQRRFGAGPVPLLLAVRSGSPASMPGMMDSVLHVGAGREACQSLGRHYGDPTFGWDIQRRFIESYATVVLKVPRAAFNPLRRRADLDRDGTLSEPEFDALIGEYERLVEHEAGQALTADPYAQLIAAIEAVLKSWDSPRAEKYRHIHGIDPGLGTAVSVQAMVYGSLSHDSCAGVAMSRDPNHGRPGLYGEYLSGALCTEVVTGSRTPDPLTRAQARRGEGERSLEAVFPAFYQQLVDVVSVLEAHFGDAQEIEFTFEAGRLWLLQCRLSPRSASAAARIAVDMVDEGRVSVDRALCRVDAASLRQLLSPQFPDPERLIASGVHPIARGLGASPGATNGRLVLDGDALERCEGPAILVRAETSSEDVAAMHRAVGVLTAAGGLTSHAAVVARSMGKPCVAGATSLHVDYVRRRVTAMSSATDQVLEEGDIIAIDGVRGLVYAAEIPAEPSRLSPHVDRLLQWADEARQVFVWAEAASLREAQEGRSFGADGLVLTLALSELPRLLHAVGDTPVTFVAADAAAATSARAALRPGDRIAVHGDVFAVLDRSGNIEGRRAYRLLGDDAARSEEEAVWWRRPSGLGGARGQLLRPGDVVSCPSVEVPLWRLQTGRLSVQKRCV